MARWYSRWACRGAPLVALTWLLASGCASLPPGTWHDAAGVELAQPPALRDGDVVLTRGANAVSAVIARQGASPGIYSHSGVVVLDEQGQPGVLHLSEAGLHVQSMDKFLDQYARVAFVRAKTPPTSAQVQASARKLLAEFGAGRLKFELAFRAQAIASGHYSCMDVVERVYAEAGLSSPFPPPAAPMPADRWSALGEKIMGAPIEGLPSANAVLSNPLYGVVGTWASAGVDDRHLAIDDTVADQVRAYYTAGEVARAAPGAAGVWADMLAGVGVTTEHQEMLMQLQGTLQAFATAVTARVGYDWRQVRPQVPSIEQVRAWTLAACASEHAKYFIPASPAPAGAAAAR